MKFKKFLLFFMLLIVVSLTTTQIAFAQTDNIKINSNTKFSDYTAKTISKNFIITHKIKKSTGYLNIKSKNSKIKIKSIKIKQGNGFKGFKWKTYKINSKKPKTIRLGKNTFANVYQDGNWGKITYIIKYKK